MIRINNSTQKRSWAAFVMGMTMTGMGQIFNGELLKGVSFFIIFTLALLTGFRLSVNLPDRFLIIGIGGTLLVLLSMYLFAIFKTYKKAKVSEKPDHKAYNQWYFYIAVWMCGTLFVTTAALNYTKQNIVQAYKIPAKSMEPVILKGDHILVEKAAYRRTSPEIGNIVIFVYPDDRSKAFMKRVAGLPDDAVTLSSGVEANVPHGTIYVIGDNRGKWN